MRWAAPVTAVSWNRANPDVVLSGSKDGSVKLWSLASGKAATTVDPPFMPTAVVWHPADAARLAVGLEDGSVCEYDARRPDAPTAVKTKHAAAVFALAYHSESGRLASGSDDTTVRVCDAEGAV